MIRFNVSDAQLKIRMRKLKAAFSQRATLPVIRRQMMITKKNLVEKTPKRWTGQTRRSWQTIMIPNGVAVTNISKVMVFLEKGTQAHGPRRAKFLYIPLNRKAAIGGWNPSLKRGKDYRLAKRVKGIVAMNIVGRERLLAQRRMLVDMQIFIRAAMAKVMA